MDTIDTIQQQEVRRRLRLLGPLADAPYNYLLLRQRAKEVFVPARILWDWWHSHQERGFDGLLPDWNEADMTDQMRTIIAKRLTQLEEIVHVDVITVDHLQALAKRNRWSPRTTERWVRRYQVGGWWGLAQDHNPEKEQQCKKKRRPPALGVLDNAAIEEIFRRRELLGDFALRQTVPRIEVEEKAKTAGIAACTLWRYIQQYRQYGLAGLAPRSRSDKHTHHGITGEMTEIVRGVRFSQPGKTVQAVHQAVSQKAQALGEVAPTLWQVRQICAEMSRPERLLADRRDDDFRNRYEVTRKMEDLRQQSSLISYQIDHNLVDVLVKDLRNETCRTKSGTVRPWLTLCIDSRSRLVMAAIFSYDRPDRHTVAAAIREAILLSDGKPYGGIPHEIRVDNGYELLSRHVQQLTEELHIMLLPCTPHQPQQKGIVERFFGTLNTRLWSDQPGYVDSNTVERNPQVKAVLTLQELEERFWRFIEQYHQEIHSETKEAPLEYWLTHCYAEPADPRQLDLLLQEPATRKIIKVGIVYEKRVYWHDALAPFVGTRVSVRAEPHYRGAPDTIEVFLEDQWLCTASATDSLQGQAVTSEDMMHAKHEQKAILRHAINEAKEMVEAADQAIANLSQKDGTDAPQPIRRLTSTPRKAKNHLQSPPEPSEQPSASRELDRPRDVLDVMADQAFHAQEEKHE